MNERTRATEPASEPILCLNSVVVAQKQGLRFDFWSEDAACVRAASRSFSRCLYFCVCFLHPSSDLSLSLSHLRLQRSGYHSYASALVHPPSLSRALESHLSLSRSCFVCVLCPLLCAYSSDNLPMGAWDLSSPGAAVRASSLILPFSSFLLSLVFLRLYSSVIHLTTRLWVPGTCLDTPLAFCLSLLRVSIRSALLGVHLSVNRLRSLPLLLSPAATPPLPLSYLQ